MRQSLQLFILIISGLMLQLTATAQPVDVTDSITNPNFETGNLDGWSNPNSFQTQTNAAFAYKAGTYYCEKWQGSGSWTDIGVSQTLPSMPNGLYKLRAAAMSGGGGAYVFANEDSTEVDAAGNYDVFFAVDADTIKLGYYVVDGSNYVTCDNFTLIFYGDSYSAGLDALIDSANAIITTAADLGDYTTETYANLQAATDSGQSIVDDVASTTEDFTDGEAYMEAAIADYHKVVSLIDYEATWPSALPYDATGVIANPSFEAGSLEGWSNPNAFKTNTSAQPFKSGTYFCEIWQSSATGGWADIGISQTVKYIPNGTYLLTVGGQSIDQSDGSYPGNAYFYANDDSVEVFAPNTYTVTAEVTDNTLDIGYILVGTSGNWLALDNFKLTYFGEGAPVIATSETELTFDEVNPSHSFTVSGFNLLDSILTISAPSGFDIDIDTIVVDTTTSVAPETTVTVSMTDTAMFNGDIVLTCGVYSQSITIVEGTKTYFTPDPAISYYLKIDGFDKIMGSAETTPKVYDFDPSAAQQFTFEESDSAAGEYFIKSSNNGYLHKVASSGWDMLFDEATDSTLEANDDYHFVFEPSDNETQLIHCVNAVGGDRYVGPNAGSATDGSTIYADKKTSNGEVTWVFVDPAEIDFEVTESYVTFDDVKTTGTITVNGNKTLLSDFTIEATTGFSVDTTAASLNGESTITVTFDASAELKDFITISSSGISKRVRVLGYLNAAMFTPLYSNDHNMISDPYCTDISIYDSWGDEQLITDTTVVYGGASCIGLPAGTNNSGSLNYVLDGEIESDTYYHISFAYRTIGGTMHLTFDDFYVDGQDGEVNFFLPTTDGDWVVYDTIVSSGTLDDATQSIYLNTYQATATELYIDNYQFFVVPLVAVDDSVAPTSTTTDEFKVAVQDVAGTVNITAPAGITVSPTSLATDAGMATVTVSFDNSVAVDGYIELSDGVNTDRIYVSATVSASSSPIVVVEESVAPTQSTTDEFNVTVQNAAGTVSITAPAGITVNPATLAADAGASKVTVTFDNSADVDGYIVLSDGVDSDSIHVTASKVTSINKTLTNNDINAYFSNGSINVNFSMENGGNVQFIVYNITGAAKYQKAMNLPAGNQHQILDAELSSGIYMLSIVKDGKKSTVKLVK